MNIKPEKHICPKCGETMKLYSTGYYIKAMRCEKCKTSKIVEVKR